MISLRRRARIPPPLAALQLAGLEELLRRGERNGVPLERVTVQQAKEIEPLVKTHEYAIWSPSTAAADPTEVTLSIAKDAAEEGVEFRTDTAYVRAEGALDGSGDYSVVTSHGRIVAGHLVNCAGLYADKVAHDFGFGKDLVVLPFKGLYLYCNVPLRTLVYPVPNLSQPFLGVHFTVTVDGKCKIGPTAIPAFWREQYGFLDHFKAGEFLEVAATCVWLGSHVGPSVRRRKGSARPVFGPRCVPLLAPPSFPSFLRLGVQRGVAVRGREL